MSDQKLRDLERRWRETGTVEDEAAYLLERVRVGDLGRDRLELASYCWHEASAQLLSDSNERHANDERVAWSRGLAAFSPSLAEAKEWMTGLVTFGHDALIRASLALSELLLPTWQSQMRKREAQRRPAWRASTDLDFEDAVMRVSAWCVCPCSTHAAPIGARLFTFGETGIGMTEALMAVWVGNHMLGQFHNRAEDSPGEALDRTAAAVWMTMYRAAGDREPLLREATSPAARRLPGGVVRSVRTVLVQWVLYGETVRSTPFEHA